MLEGPPIFRYIQYEFSLLDHLERTMGYNFRDYNPNQLLLLAPNLDDWLPQEHMARFISDVVNALDLKPFLRRFRANGQGGAAFHPAMMLKVVLYAYCVGVPSSRKIAQAVIDDVAFRWLAANNRPDFRTIATFRRKHLEDIKPLFLQVLLLCKQAGMVRVGVVALDGTKVAANAAMDRNRTWEKLSEQEKALMAEVESLLGRAEAADRQEDDRFGDDSGDGLPKVATAKERLALIRRAKDELETQARERAREQEAAGREGGGRGQGQPDGPGKPDHEDAQGVHPGIQRPGRGEPGPDRGGLRRCAGVQ